MKIQSYKKNSFEKRKKKVVLYYEKKINEIVNVSKKVLVISQP